MTVTGIPADGPGGVPRLTVVCDQLAHVLEHCDTDEPSGTWTGLACPDHGLAPGPRRRHRDRTAPVHSRPARRPDLGSPAGLTAEHGQLLRAAIQAYHAGRPRLPGSYGTRPEPWSRA
jgi:hypothetical protein